MAGRPWPTRGAVDVHLLPASPAAVGAARGAGAVLSSEERDRAQAFRRPEDRALYEVAHVGLRHVVSPYVGVDPAALVLGAAPCPVCGGPHGRPVLPQAPGLHLSLSHATGLAVVALATDPVGVDVEPRGRPSDDLEHLVAELHPAERRLVATSADRRAALLRCWVRKESYAKGRGVGLAEPLHERSTASPLAHGVTEDGWHVVDLDAAGDHVGAVALLLPAGSPPPTLRIVGPPAGG